MTNEDELIQKLMVSKKIMERHDTIGRGTARNVNYSAPEVASYDAPQATYNLPQDILMETQQYQTPPVNTSQQVPTKDRIMSSKLPDEIKQLMMEHPIAQPNSMSGPTLSNDLVEKASRLMNANAKGEQVTGRQPQTPRPQSNKYNVNADDIRSIVRETVEEVLKENGLLVESTKKSNDVFKFRVGQHIFEGKVTKVRKVTE